MIKLQQKIKLPLLLLAGSLILIIGIMFLTNPLHSIIYVVLFFAALLVFLGSGSFLLINLQNKQGISKPAARRVFIGSAAVVILIMLRSAQALTLLDLGLMIVFFGGLVFYTSRR